MFFIQHDEILVNLEQVSHITTVQQSYTFSIVFHIPVTISSDEFGTVGEKTIDFVFSDVAKGMIYYEKLKKILVKLND